ncbi:MAG: hypothetical protein ACI4F4_02485 [Lachnospiraceae bacterium]
MKKNQGSATIEMTMLIGMILGIVILYIMYLLFSIGFSKNLYMETENLYQQNKNVQVEVNGSMAQIPYNIFHVKNYQITSHLQRDKENPVAFIRRCQLASRGIS